MRKISESIKQQFQNPKDELLVLLINCIFWGIIGLLIIFHEQIVAVIVNGGVMSVIAFVLVVSISVYAERRIRDVEEQLEEEKQLRAAAEEDLLDTWYGFIEFSSPIENRPRESVSLRETKIPHHFIIKAGVEKHLMSTTLLPWVSSINNHGWYDGPEVDYEMPQFKFVDGLRDIDYKELECDELGPYPPSARNNFY